MKWSLNLGRIAGINIKMHWTFLILILWIVFAELGKGSGTSTILLTVGFVLTIFFCVVLHELGHALTARRYGIKTKKITLLPIGGVANLGRIPEEPKQELLIAIAGPLVNVVIALLLYPFIPFEKLMGQGSEAIQKITTDNFLYSLFAINIILVVFNLIPAFPMDGGRMLRALLSFKMERITATKIASTLGQGLAILFVILGFFSNPWLIFIGVFVFAGAYGENMMVQHMEFLKGHTVEEAMMTDYASLTADQTVKDAVRKIMEGPEQDFVVTKDGEIIGVVAFERLMEAVKNKQLGINLEQIAEKPSKILRPTDKLSQLYTKIQSGKTKLFPVSENGKLKGILDRQSLQEFITFQSALN